MEPDGQTAIVDGVSKPGDYVDLRADMDVLTVISNCPQTHNPCNGFRPTPIRLVRWGAAGVTGEEPFTTRGRAGGTSALPRWLGAKRPRTAPVIWRDFEAIGVQSRADR